MSLPLGPLPSAASTKPAWHSLWWLLPPLCLGALAINGSSFWIDECLTARFVSQPTLAAWWDDLRTTTYPEAQLPLYVFYLWVWDKLCGHGEWSLRLAALPWFVPGVAAFLYGLRRVGSRGLATVLVTVSSAFLWYYLNEARPYAMQAGVSCLLCAALAECQTAAPDARPRWFVVFVVGLLLLGAISIIGMVWISAAIIAAWGRLPAATWKSWGWRYRKTLALVVGLLGVLAAYYLWTVGRGAKATMIGTTNWQSIVFILYEQLGFTGIGPGRAELRERGAQALLPYAALLGLYGVAVGTILFAGLRVVWRADRRQVTWIAAGLAVPVVFFLVSGWLAHFRVLGRHLTPLLPVWLLVLGCGASRLWRHGRAGRAVVVLFFGFSLASALEIRWAPRHRKDDYRSAVAFSQAALDSGKTVWWNASHEAATHYQLPLTSAPQQPHKAVLIFNPAAGKLAELPLPDLAVVSKPDIYDPGRTVMNFLKQSGYQHLTNFPAFEIWGRNR